MAKIRKPVTRQVKMLYEQQCKGFDDFALTALLAEELSKGEPRAVFAKIAERVLDQRRAKKAA